MNKIIKQKNSKIFQKSAVVIGLFFLCCGVVYADSMGGSVGLGAIARNIMTSFRDLGQLMLAIAYLSGFGFTISSIFKFKQHKDNPTQIPVSTPLALLIVGIVLIFLPGIIEPAGVTIFGAQANLENMAGGFTGGGVTGIPGQNE